MNIHCTADKYNFTFSHQVSCPVQKRGHHPAYAFLHTVPFWMMPASPFTVLWSFFLPVLWSSVQPGHQGRCWGATEQHCTRLRGKRILRLSCFQTKDQQAAIGRTSQNPGRTHQEYQLLLKETIAGGCHEFKENGRASQPQFRLPPLHSLCPLGFLLTLMLGSLPLHSLPGEAHLVLWLYWHLWNLSLHPLIPSSPPHCQISWEWIYIPNRYL